MISAGNRAMLIDGAEIGVVVEKNTAIHNRTESHDGFMVVELDPKRIIGGHGDFVMCVKANELEGGLAGSIDDSLDIGIGNANYGVTAAIFLATYANIFYTVGSWMVLLVLNKAPRR